MSIAIHDKLENRTDKAQKPRNILRRDKQHDPHHHDKNHHMLHKACDSSPVGCCSLLDRADSNLLATGNEQGGMTMKDNGLRVKRQGNE